MKIIFLLSTIIGITLFTRSAVAEQIHVYFGSRNNIYFSLLDINTGKLSTPQLALEIDNPGFIVIHPDKKFIYTTTSGMPDSKNGGVAALKINDDGTLTFINKQSSEGRNPCHVNIDASGKCLMTVNYSSGSVASYKINKDGSLSKAVSVHQHKGSVPDSRRQTEPHPHSVFPNQVNNFAYVPDLGMDKIMIYKINSEEATLTEAGFAKILGDNMGPRHMKWDSAGKYAYVLNELKPELTVLKATGNNGKLEYITDLSTLPADIDTKNMYGSEIRIHPNGKFIYAAMRDTGDKNRDLIAVFNTFDSDNPGKLIDMTPTEVSVPRNFNIDPSGKWMLIAGMTSHDIAIFSINEETGKLTFTGKKIPFEGSPICIAFLNK